MNIHNSELEALGNSLRLINTDLMKIAEAGPDTQRLWYQGKESYFDIMVELQAQVITWLQVTLRGKVLSCKPPTTLWTGETEELDVPPQVAYYAASKTIRDGATVNWEFVQDMATMLSHRSDEPILAMLHKILVGQLNQHFETV